MMHFYKSRYLAKKAGYTIISKCCGGVWAFDDLNIQKLWKNQK